MDVSATTVQTTPPAVRPLERVVWHCGFQKTATTTIQSMLAANRAHLAPHCATYPKARWTRDLRQAAIQMWKTDTEESRSAVSAAAKALVEQARNSGAPVALVSDENILAEHLAQNGKDIFGFAKQVLPMLAEATAPQAATFVFYTRPLEPWLRSAYNQIVKARRCQLGWDEWRAAIPFADDFPGACADLAQATGLDIRFLDLAEDDHAGAALLKLCDLPEETLAGIELPERRANESLPSGAVAFLLEMNRSDLKTAGIQQVRRTVMRNRHLFRDGPLDDVEG